MSKTETSTIPMPTKENASSAPEIRIISRVASIPLISSSLDTINSTLLTNAFTRSPYETAKGLSTQAYKLTEPLQVTFAPIIVRADGLANMSLDAVESRFPYPFKAKPEEVADYVHGHRKSASQYAQKTYDERVKSPAFYVAQGIDQRFAPIVDYFEAAVGRVNSETNGHAGPSTSDKQYQYQRALTLSRSLAENLSVFTNEQIKQIQAQSAILQKAQETANSITNVASSSYVAAQSRIHTLSDSMLAEVQKLQSSTASLAESLQQQAQAQVPPQVQDSFQQLSKGLGDTATQLRGIITEKDLPLQMKVQKVGNEVRDRVTPLLEGVRKNVADAISHARGQAQETAPTVNGVNH